VTGDFSATPEVMTGSELCFGNLLDVTLTRPRKHLLSPRFFGSIGETAMGGSFFDGNLMIEV
jgi:hypothetical protein